MKKLGRVIEVYLPNDEELTKIGFKVEIDNQTINIIEEQNSDNAMIYRDDFVFVNINNKNDQVYYNIESLVDIEIGEEDE